MIMYAKEAALDSIRISAIKAGQVWRHVKTSRKYFVLAVGLDEVTLDPVVVYSGHDSVTWVRKLSIFLSKPNGEWRFVNDDDPAVMSSALAYLNRSTRP